MNLPWIKIRIKSPRLGSAASAQPARRRHRDSRRFTILTNSELQFFRLR